MSNKKKFSILGGLILILLAFFASLPGIDGNLTHFSVGNFLYNIIQIIIGLFCIIFLLAIYFLPMLTAKRRQHNNLPAIAMLNLFFGWSLIGWFIAFIWSLTNNVAPTA